jgi:UV DNA damage repair endonuclease
MGTKLSKQQLEEERGLNTGGTTVAWLNRQTRAVAESKLWSVAQHNLDSLRSQLARVAAMEPRLRMMRISSDLLPVYTEPTWSYFWQTSDVQGRCEREFATIGEFARANDIRVSMHPGQFCVLASADAGIVERSIEEFEYHASMARWMGYGQRFQDFKINVHISGRNGPAGMRAAYARLTPEARNTITVENEEMSWGLDNVLELADLIPVVLDVHHHWVREGEYIPHADERVQRVIDSWRGVRPTMHVSQSREDILVGHDPEIMPDMAALLAAGHKRAKLRAHSDMMWNRAVNRWVLGFNDRFDLMIEAKSKNLASTDLASMT